MTEKIVELIGPLQRIGEILAAHRLEFEHERTGVIAEHAAVWTKHAVLEQRGVQEVGIAHPGETGLRRFLAESLGGDAIPDLADAGKAGRQRPRIGGQLFF